MEHWHPALPQTEHTFCTVPGYRQPSPSSILLTSWLRLPPGLPEPAQDQEGKKAGGGERARRKLQQAPHSRRKTWKKQFKALLHTTVATGYHSSLPLPLLMPLCHALVLSQSLAKTRITGESSHTLKIHFLQTMSTSAPRPQEKPNLEQRSLRNLHQKTDTLTLI